MSSRKPATTTRPDLPNETTKRRLSKVPDLPPESPPEASEPTESTDAVVVPDPVVDPPKK